MRPAALVTAFCLVGSLPSSADEAIDPVNPAIHGKVYNEVYDKIVVEVNRSEDRIKASLPELRFAKQGGFIPLCATEKIILEGTDARGFQVQIFSVSAMSFPGNDFALAYLLNPKGEIVDWKSQWLYNRRGKLVTRLADANNDGTKEFCFVCERFKAPDEILAAFTLNAQRLKTVIAEPVSTFTIEFTETALPDGVILRPRLQGVLQWETGKLYEIPVRVQNNGKEARSLLDSSIWLSGQFYGGGTSGNLAAEELKPKETVDSLITVRFTEVPTDKQFGFKLEKH